MKKLLHLFIKLAASFLVVFIMGLFIGFVTDPFETSGEVIVANIGEGMGKSLIIVVFLWAAYGSYKKWRNRNKPQESPEVTRKRSIKEIVIITTIGAILMIIGALSVVSSMNQ